MEKKSEEIPANTVWEHGVHSRVQSACTEERYVLQVRVWFPFKKNVSMAKGIDLDVGEDASPGKGIDLDVANIPHNYPRT